MPPKKVTTAVLDVFINKWDFKAIPLQAFVNDAKALRCEINALTDERSQLEKDVKAQKLELDKARDEFAAKTKYLENAK